MSQIDNKLIDRNTLGSRKEQDEASQELKRQKRQREFLNTGSIPGSDRDQAREEKKAKHGFLKRQKARKIAQKKVRPWRKDAPFGLKIAVGVKEVIDFLTLGFFSPLTNFIMAIYIGVMFLIGDEELKNFLKKRIFLPMVLEFIPIVSIMPWYVMFVFGAKLKTD
ncbi:hypothetical protein K8R62_02110 [bacterium]|nr:hypothetical protein [bacterium]